MGPADRIERYRKKRLVRDALVGAMIPLFRLYTGALFIIIGTMLAVWLVFTVIKDVTP